MPRAAIDRANVRATLLPQREPYWGAPVERGLYVGFRKLTDGGTWIARRRDDDGRQRYQRLGLVSPTFDYQVACGLARAWVRDQIAGVDRKDVRTVADACAAYVADRLKEKGKANSHDAELRFARTVGAHKIGKLNLDRLRQVQIEAWRDELIVPKESGRALSKASANRTLTALKAALNFAVSRRHVGKERAIEWDSVKAFAGAGKRRELFLDLAQRRALLASATGPVRDLIEAAMLTGARPGELVAATRSAFDHRTEVLNLSGKTGARKVPLAPGALALFKRLAKDKLPGALLLARDGGAQWRPWDWDGLVRDAAADAKLPLGVCMYTLRHSWITAAIQGGMTTLEVARLCGTSLLMIDRNYGQLAPSAARERLATVEFA